MYVRKYQNIWLNIAITSIAPLKRVYHLWCARPYPNILAILQAIYPTISWCMTSLTGLRTENKVYTITKNYNCAF